MNIVCPYCGGEICISMKWEGHGYGSYEVIDVIECQVCWAEWEPDGKLRLEPR